MSLATVFFGCRRTDLGIVRELHPEKCKTAKNFKYGSSYPDISC